MDPARTLWLAGKDGSVVVRGRRNTEYAVCFASARSLVAKGLAVWVNYHWKAIRQTPEGHETLTRKFEGEHHAEDAGR